MSKIDEKYLKGLDLRIAATRTEKDEEGKKKKEKYATTRPLAAKDVISFKDYGDHVVIVASDGMKHTVRKDGKPTATQKAAAEKEAADKKAADKKAAGGK